MVVERARKKKRSYAKHNEQGTPKDSLEAIKKIYNFGCRFLIYKAIFVVSQLVRVALRPVVPLASATSAKRLWIGLMPGTAVLLLLLPPILERDPYVYVGL